MKLASLVLILAFAAIAQAQCPDISGEYTLVKQTQDAKGLLPGSELSKISPFDFVSNTQIGFFGETSNITLRNQDLNLSRTEISFIVDGAEHMLSEDKNADNYFQKYTARCEANTIVIEESGSNNDTNMKRVDTYKSKTIIRLLPNRGISREVVAEQSAVSGKLARKGFIKQEYKRTK